MAETESGNGRLRAGGLWLAAGATLLTITFIFHGPPAPHVADQMTVIAGSPLRWVAAHWLAAVALSLFAMAGLLVLSGGARMARGPLISSAWAAMVLGALWTLVTAVAEATAVTKMAIDGDDSGFAAWWAFSEGAANGFAAFALASALIAGNELRRKGITPVWASGLATAAGVVSFSAWAAWSWLDVGAAAPFWVASSIVLCLWLIWFGLSLAFGSVERIAGASATKRETTKGAYS